MKSASPAARGYYGPVAVVIGLFCLLNGLWTYPDLGLYDKFPHSIAVYLSTGAVALFVLWRAARDGRLSRREAGLDTSGWTAPKRLLGLGLVLFMGLGGYLSLQPPLPDTQEPSATTTVEESGQSASPADPTLPPKPNFGDYCFWFVFLLSASLSELLVFVTIGFCLVERALRLRNLRPLWAAAIAGVFASVAFGLYHYTHPPRFWGFVYFPLMPVMLINITYFVLTRNFWLTLVLHNSFASVGFVQEQWAERIKQARGLEFDPAMFPETFMRSGDTALLSILTAFVVPFLVMHWIEARSFRDFDRDASAC